MYQKVLCDLLIYTINPMISGTFSRDRRQLASFLAWRYIYRTFHCLQPTLRKVLKRFRFGGMRYILTEFKRSILRVPVEIQVRKSFFFVRKVYVGEVGNADRKFQFIFHHKVKGFRLCCWLQMATWLAETQLTLDTNSVSLHFYVLKWTSSLEATRIFISRV